MTKHCEKGGAYIKPNEQPINLCAECHFKQPFGAPCDFCKETNCVAWGNDYFKTINKKIYVDFRADMEANQIDCQFGILDDDGTAIEGTWSNFAIDINFCPVCGRRLPEAE